MKTLTNDMVAHSFANQNITSAKNANYSFYFQGKIIYSYNSGFPIAKIIDENTVLFTSRDYSNTTGKHKSLVYSAISHYKIFVIPNVDIRKTTNKEFYLYKNQHDENLLYIKNEIKKTLIDFSNSRKYKESHYNSAINLVSQYNDYLKFFKIRRKSIILPNAEKLAIDAKIQNEKNRKIKKLARIKKQKTDLIAINKWLSGELSSMPWGVSTPVLLRINPKNPNEIETSKNARFPVSHAMRVYNMLKTVKTGSYSNINFKIGYFAITRINTDKSVIAGCHKVEWNIIKSMGEKLESLAE